MTHAQTTSRIVVGIDGSEASRDALRWAIGQAGLTGATIEAVMTWEYPIAYGLGPDIDAETLIKVSEQILGETVTAVAGDDPPVPIQTSVVEGHPAHVLIKRAAGARLLVLGSRGHGGFVGTMLGSVSQYCAQHAPCPVVIIRGAAEQR